MRTGPRRIGRSRWFVGLVVATLLASCSDRRSPAEARAALAERSSGDILVAAVWPWSARNDLLYAEGLELALEEIDAGGGVGGRPMKLVRVDDSESLGEGRLVAQRLAQDLEVVAVIGHLQSYVTVPAAAIYDLAGLLLLAPAATDLELTSRGYRLVFRLVFTDRTVAEQMAEYAEEQGYRRLAIYYVRNNYGRALANAFEERATAGDLTIVARASYDEGDSADGRGFTTTLRAWKELELDAVFVAGTVPLASTLIAEMRRHGITAPVLGGDAMGVPTLIRSGGSAVEGTVVAASFHPAEPRGEVDRFTRRFLQRYGKEPDAAAALGYDALRLLAEAMRRAQSTVPAEVASALREIESWEGVTGSFSFDENGDLRDRRAVRIEVRNGRFEFVSATAGAPLGPPDT